MKVKELFEEKEVTIIGQQINNKIYTSEMENIRWPTSFYCSNLKLTTLKGCPKIVDKVFACNDNNLTSLDGCPSYIGESFYCFNNELTSLKNGPEVVKENYNCSNNNLENLDGILKKINGVLDCANNDIETFKNGPTEVGGILNCSFNSLSNFEGFPKTIGGHLHINNNRFESLKDIHKHIKKINGKFICFGNPIKSHILGILLIEGITEARFSNVSKKIPQQNNYGYEEIINKYLPNMRGRAALYECQDELIQAGLEEYAQL